MGLKRRDVDGDGSCMYHAIAYQCEYNMRELRKMGANELTEHEFTYRFVTDETNTGNLDLFKQCLSERGVSVPDNHEQIREIYTRKVESTNEWGSSIELHALSNALERQIRVFHVEGSKVGVYETFGENHTSKPSINLWYNDSNHYEALIRVSSNEEKVSDESEEGEMSSGDVEFETQYVQVQRLKPHTPTNVNNFAPQTQR